MAEIHIEPRRKSAGWLWIVIALIIVGALVCYALTKRGAANAAVPPAGATPAVRRAAPVRQAPLWSVAA